MFIIFFQHAQAQTHLVSGAVTDSSGKPLTGVSVKVKNAAMAVSSDANGRFSINVPDPHGILVFTSIGFTTQEVPVNNRSVIDVLMKVDVQSLDKVVVIGYGVQQKKTLTGAVASVGEDQLRALPVGDAASRLEGRVAGVTVTSNNAPGGGTVVRVRGIGSINNNDPLYIIDGVPTTSGLGNINPNDVESMTVLKDASSSAIYGSRAANGVIVVTTRRGKSGKPKLSLDVRYGVQKAANSLGLLNTKEIGELLWQKYKNVGLVPGNAGWGDLQYGYGASPVIPEYIFPNGQPAGAVDESKYNYPSPYYGITKANKNGTDWQHEVFAPAPVQEYNLALSGGNDKSNYALSAAYYEQKGIIIHTGLKRYSLRSNADFQITNWLKIGQTLGATYSNLRGNTGTGPINTALLIHPIIPIYDIRGNYAGTKSQGTGNQQNPVATLFRDKDDYNRGVRVLANVYSQINFTKDLTFKTLLGIDYVTNRIKDRTLSAPEFTQDNGISSLNESQGTGLQYNWANTLNYKKTIHDDHRINVLLGTEAVNNSSELFSASRSTFAFTNVNYMILDAGEKDYANAGSYDQWALSSYFGRLNYDYQGKYLFEAVVRRDGSSRFSKDNRWGTFPALSAGWRISQESFMQNIGWLSDLKLRVGYGQNGNDNVGNYNAYSTYRSAGTESYYNITGANSSSSAAGFHQYKLGNPDGQWEATETTNLGMDLSLFNNSFEANLDIYSRTTTNMLYPDSKPATWGGLVLPSINIGKMKNTGIDLMLTYRGTAGKNFNYRITANASHYKNQVIKLNNNPNEIRYGNSLLTDVYTATTAGRPISSFYGYVVEGIFNTAQEVAAWPKYNPDINGKDAYSMPGVFKYKDVNGDGKITAADRDFIGSPHPDLTYGFNIDMQYRNFDLIMFFQGVAGNKMVDFENRGLLFSRYDGNYLRRRLYESWTPERYAGGARITVPMTTTNDANMQKPSTFFVEDASYFRMKDLQIGYTVPSHITSRLKVERLRFYAQASNLFTITRYSGLDPEVSSTNVIHMGVDEGIYPTSRILVFGINLGL